MAAQKLRPVRSGAWTRQLVIMARFPIAGRVKSRLARDVGIVRATQFYRHTASAVIARLATGGRWRTTLALTPDYGPAPAHWLRRASRMPQGAGDLGRRMQRIMDRAAPGPVVIVGTDIPSLRATDIAAAFAALGRFDAVFGPAVDGGYWLVGLKRTPRVPRAFANVRWSTSEALADTKTSLAAYKVGDVRTLSDIDCGADLARDRGRHGRMIRPAIYQPTGSTVVFPPDHLSTDRRQPLE